MSQEALSEALMRKALTLAEKALMAGEFPVGCVIARGERVVAEGFRRNSRPGSLNELDHAEMGALGRLAETGPHDNPGDLSIFTTLEPCLMCFGAIALSGIGRIVYAYEDVMGGGSDLPAEALAPLYQNSGPVVEGGVLRLESAALFKKYFSDPAHSYWKDSLLARHALGLGPDEKKAESGRMDFF